MQQWRVANLDPIWPGSNWTHSGAGQSLVAFTTLLCVDILPRWRATMVRAVPHAIHRAFYSHRIMTHCQALSGASWTSTLDIEKIHLYMISNIHSRDHLLQIVHRGRHSACVVPLRKAFEMAEGPEQIPQLRHWIATRNSRQHARIARTF